MGVCQTKQPLPSREIASYILAFDLLIDLYSSPSASAFHKNYALSFKKRGLAESSFANIADCLSQCYDSSTFSTSIRFLALYQLKKIKKSFEAQNPYDKESYVSVQNESEIQEHMVIVIKLALSQTPIIGYQPPLLSMSKLLNRLGKWEQEKNVLLQLVERQPINTHYCVLLARSFIKFEEKPGLLQIINQALQQQPYLQTQDDYAMDKETLLNKSQRSYFSSLLHIKGQLLHNERMTTKKVRQCFKKSIEVNLNSEEPYLQFLRFLASKSQISMSLSRLVSQYKFSRFESCCIQLPYVAYSLGDIQEAQQLALKIEKRLSMAVLVRQQAINCLLALRKLLEVQNLSPCHCLSVVSKMLNSQPEFEESEQLFYAKLRFREGQASSCINILKKARTSSLIKRKTDDIDLMLAVSYCSLGIISEAQNIFNGFKVRLGRDFSQSFKQAALLQEKPEELLNNFMNFMQVFSVVSPYQFRLFSDNVSFIEQLPLMMKVQVKVLKLRNLTHPSLVEATFKEIEELVGFRKVDHQISMRKLYFYLMEIGGKYHQERIRFYMYLDYIFEKVKHQQVRTNCQSFNHSLLPDNINSQAHERSEYPSPEFILW